VGAGGDDGLADQLDHAGLALPGLHPLVQSDLHLVLVGEFVRVGHGFGVGGGLALGPFPDHFVVDALGDQLLRVTAPDEEAEAPLFDAVESVGRDLEGDTLARGEVLEGKQQCRHIHGQLEVFALLPYEGLTPGPHRVGGGESVACEGQALLVVGGLAVRDADDGLTPGVVHALQGQRVYTLVDHVGAE